MVETTGDAQVPVSKLCPPGGYSMIRDPVGCLGRKIRSGNPSDYGLASRKMMI